MAEWMVSKMALCWAEMMDQKKVGQRAVMKVELMRAEMTAETMAESWADLLGTG